MNGRLGKNKKNSPIKNGLADLEWYNDQGQLHRTDGPAIEDADEYKEWFILNRYLVKKNFNNWILRIRELFYLNAFTKY